MISSVIGMMMMFTPPKPKRSHKRIAKTGTDLHVTHDILSSPILNSCAIRNGMTPTSVAALLKVFISECSKNLNDLYTEYTHVTSRVTKKKELLMAFNNEGTLLKFKP